MKTPKKPRTPKATTAHRGPAEEDAEGAGGRTPKVPGARETPTPPTAAPEHDPTAHLYARISDPVQRKGTGLERQAEGNVAEFADLYGFVVSKRILVDDGVSAFRGLNATPEHQLGQFLVEARQGLIPRGDCLVLENYDRLSRQDPWSAIGLVSELKQLGIHIGRLDRMKLLRAESTDPGDFFEASVEFMRGNSESATKSERNKKWWRRQRKLAREGKAVLTPMLPAWLEVRDGKAVLIPERAAIVRRIFALTAAGHGRMAIVRLFTAEGVPAFGGREALLGDDGQPVKQKAGRRKGKPCVRMVGGRLGSGRWTRGYIGLILGDRRVLGELRPKHRDGTPAGEVIPIPAVVSEAEWDAARGVAGKRRLPRGPAGKRIELFSGLVHDARDGGSYYAGSRAGDHGRYRVLFPTNAVEGRATNRSFPTATFEAAVLTCLEEIDPHEILNGDDGPDKTQALGAELAGVEASIAAINAEMDRHGDNQELMARLRRKGDRKAELVKLLAEERQKAAHPLSESWGEAQGLIEALDRAPDPADARRRLRAALRRIVEDIRLLVVPRGRDRLAYVQLYFEGGRQRDYCIWHRPPMGNGHARQDGWWRVLSWRTDVLEELGLRRPDFRTPGEPWSSLEDFEAHLTELTTPPFDRAFLAEPAHPLG
jgi:DNA invertase Pin-like site-specific DNA recombinase